MRIGFFCFIALLIAALSGGFGAAGEPTPFQQFLAAKDLDKNLDSVHYKYMWQEEGGEDASAPFRFAIQNKEIFEDGFLVEAETIRGIGLPSGSYHPPVTVTYLRNGFSYTKEGMSRSSPKVKRAVPPVPMHGRLLLRIPDEERDIASQERTGNVIRFTCDAEAMNACMEEGASDRRFGESSVEVTLNDDGTIRKITASGKFVRTGDGAEKEHLRYRESIEILQRGNVVIRFPNDLDTYAESEQE